MNAIQRLVTMLINIGSTHAPHQGSGAGEPSHAKGEANDERRELAGPIDCRQHFILILAYTAHGEFQKFKCNSCNHARSSNCAGVFEISAHRHKCETQNATLVHSPPAVRAFRSELDAATTTASSSFLETLRLLRFAAMFSEKMAKVCESAVQH